MNIDNMNQTEKHGLMVLGLFVAGIFILVFGIKVGSLLHSIPLAYALIAFTIITLALAIGAGYWRYSWLKENNI